VVFGVVLTLLIAVLAVAILIVIVGYCIMVIRKDLNKKKPVVKAAGTTGNKSAEPPAAESAKTPSSKPD
jgi:hypothetical protein